MLTTRIPTIISIDDDDPILIDDSDDDMQALSCGSSTPSGHGRYGISSVSSEPSIVYVSRPRLMNADTMGELRPSNDTPSESPYQIREAVYLGNPNEPRILQRGGRAYANGIGRSVSHTVERSRGLSPSLSLIESLSIRKENTRAESVIIALDDDDEDQGFNAQDLGVIERHSKAVSDTACRKSSENYPSRNPPIALPLERLNEFLHGDIRLRQGKCVELVEGDFLYVQAVVRNVRNGQVTIRGHRLQRWGVMNGMLERKLNEVCLFYEIDLDDPRPTLEQSIIEVSLTQVKKLRNLRWTNQKFPRDRNIETTNFANQEEAQSEGGLTVRWKYTCSYLTAEKRHLNDFQERKLQRLGEDELHIPAAVTDGARRFEWRGETIPGGAYQPHIMAKERTDRRILHVNGSISTPITSRSTPGTAPVHLNLARSTSPLFSASRFRDSTGTRKSSTAYQSVAKRNREEEDVMNETAEGEKKIKLGGKPDDSTITIDLEAQSPAAAIFKSVEDPSSRLSFTEGSIPFSGSILSIPAYKSARRTRSDGQMLTYGDAFCGGGGTTRGAAMAGLRVKWGFDFNPHACKTWRANFPEAACYEMASHQFVQVAQRAAENGSPDLMKVDILHLSPPCQFFSDAHSVNGKEDENNTASLFAVRAVIELAKPRIATLEQTFGITRKKHRWYLNALIQMFTSLDFSVRWTISPLARWGLPQSRKRLIFIAACPGEILPPFPAFTHSNDPADNLKPFTTVNQTLSQIPWNAPNHEDAYRWSATASKKAYDGDAILPRAMTCNGGQNWHPSGKRDFTLREYASLQGFPPNHRFCGNYIRKQIGNAVPPVAAKVLFKGIKDAMDEEDGIVKQREVVYIG